jgi:hypothetical protein
MDIVAGLMIMVVAFGFIVHFAPEHTIPTPKRRMNGYWGDPKMGCERWENWRNYGYGRGGWVPEAPLPPKPPTGMSGQELVGAMRKDLEDFKAGRPSMLGKTVSKHGDECGIDATDRDAICRKMSESLEADCRDPINWDKELKELK